MPRFRRSAPPPTAPSLLPPTPGGSSNPSPTPALVSTRALFLRRFPSVDAPGIRTRARGVPRRPFHRPFPRRAQRRGLRRPRASTPRRPRRSSVSIPSPIRGLRVEERREEMREFVVRAAVREERRHHLIDVDRSVRGRGARRGDRTPGGDVRGDPSTARRPLSRDGWVRVHVARDELGEFVLHAIVAEFGREVELPPPAFVVQASERDVAVPARAPRRTERRRRGGKPSRRYRVRGFDAAPRRRVFSCADSEREEEA